MKLERASERFYGSVEIAESCFARGVRLAIETVSIRLKQRAHPGPQSLDQLTRRYGPEALAIVREADIAPFFMGEDNAEGAVHSGEAKLRSLLRRGDAGDSVEEVADRRKEHHRLIRHPSLRRDLPSWRPDGDVPEVEAVNVLWNVLDLEVKWLHESTLRRSVASASRRKHGDDPTIVAIDGHLHALALSVDLHGVLERLELSVGVRRHAAPTRLKIAL